MAELRRWSFFRRRFSDLWKRPPLGYADLTGREEGEREFCFCGAFESISDRGRLWIRNSTLTVQADLSNAQTYVFPNSDEDVPAAFESGAGVPERIRWDRISSLTRNAKVFVGGPLVKQENRRVFASRPDAPLFIIFYEGPEKNLALRIIGAGRHRNEYFNFLTPYAFILGAFSEFLIAASFFARPAYRLTMIAALIALFIPLLPWIPPGILFTVAYRRLWSLGRTCRAYRDLARFPIEKEPENGKTDIPLAGNEAAGGYEERGAATGADSYNRKAWVLVIAAWIMLLAGLALNVFFIILILSQIHG